MESAFQKSGPVINLMIVVITVMNQPRMVHIVVQLIPVHEQISNVRQVENVSIQLFVAMEEMIVEQMITQMSKGVPLGRVETTNSGVQMEGVYPINGDVIRIMIVGIKVMKLIVAQLSVKTIS
jgi:hypothetical protein